jgi:chromosome segregation ATPase
MKAVRTLCRVVGIMVFFTAGLYAQEASSGTVSTSEAQRPSETAAETKSINTAISDLNYKIELLHGRYTQLTQQIEELQTADRNLKKDIAVQQSGQSDPMELERLQSEVALVRSEMAQVREELTLLKQPAEEKKEKLSSSGEIRSINDIIYASWLPAAAMGVALLALLF